MGAVLWLTPMILMDMLGSVRVDWLGSQNYGLRKEEVAIRLRERQRRWVVLFWKQYLAIALNSMAVRGATVT